MNAVAGAIPLAVMLAFFGVLLKVRVSGDPALWKRIEALEAKIDAAHDEMMLERKECAARISKLEGIIRQLQQRQASFGNLGDDRPLAGPLRTVFKPDQDTSKDADLIGKLNRKQGRNRNGRSR